jgi:6-pyruvoyltetrahydropterin/6-carboxytetrahydropterin synthase
MNKIKKIYETETAHIVRGASSERCKYNIHGHSYKWEIEIVGKVNEIGMIIDFIDLKPIKEFIDKFDHSMVLWSKEDINFINFFKKNCRRVVIMNKNTTAENMSSLLFNFIKNWLENNYPLYTCFQVNVWETRTGCGTALSCDSEDILIEDNF